MFLMILSVVLVTALVVICFYLILVVRDQITVDILNVVEENKIEPIVKHHTDTINNLNEIFDIYNRKIARLEKMFVNIGHGELLDILCKEDMLALENAKSASDASEGSPQAPKLTIVKSKD